jgi:hypothetical protein
VERFSLKNLKGVQIKESQIGLQLWKIWMLRCKLIVSGKRLERISKFNQVSSRYCEFRKHKSWFDKGCSELLDQRQQAKLQSLQDQSEINGDVLQCKT